MSSDTWVAIATGGGLVFLLEVVKIIFAPVINREGDKRAVVELELKKSRQDVDIEGIKDKATWELVDRLQAENTRLRDLLEKAEIKHEKEEEKPKSETVVTITEPQIRRIEL